MEIIIILLGVYLFALMCYCTSRLFIFFKDKNYNRRQKLKELNFNELSHLTNELTKEDVLDYVGPPDMEKTSDYWIYFFRKKGFWVLEDNYYYISFWENKVIDKGII